MGFATDLQGNYKGVASDTNNNDEFEYFFVIYFAISIVLFTFVLRKSEKNRRVKPKQGKNG